MAGQHQINPRKLLHSKWTAVTPVNREKHFMVVELLLDEKEEQIIGCVLEAVINRHQYPLDWRDLRDPQQWRQGWK